MKNQYKKIILLIFVGMFVFSVPLSGGNKDRAGQAGAQHLLIDPWAKTAGWGTAGVAEIRGLESIFSNIAGLSFLSTQSGTRLEFGFSRTQYLSSSNAGIGINEGAFAVALGKRDKNTGAVIKGYGVLGVSIFAMTFGDISRTTVESPEGNLGTFSPSLLYIGVHYAKSFNKYIHGGVTGKIINESIADMHSTGFAFDVGIQYLSGIYENFKIGITLKNIGLPMHYSGDGTSIRGIPSIASHELMLEQRSADCEMPALLAIGVSYDFLFFKKEFQELSRKDRKEYGLTREDAIHRITLAGSFTANSYSRDQFALGIEYGFMQYFMFRAGVVIEPGSLIEQGTWNSETLYTGPAAGVTIAVPLAKKGKGNQKMFLDYGYRFTKALGGNHYVSLKFTL